MPASVSPSTGSHSLFGAAQLASKNVIDVINANLLTGNNAGVAQMVANQSGSPTRPGAPQLLAPKRSLEDMKAELGDAGWQAYILGIAKELGVKTSVTSEEELSALSAAVQSRAAERRAAHDDYAEQLAKAEEAQKAMGWVSKLLGAALTVLGVVGAAFTGGLSLGLAVIGAALFVADEAHQAATGESFMAKALKPVMDAITPAIAYLAKHLTTALVKLGVNEEAAAITANVVVMVAAVAVAIVATMAAKAAIPMDKIAAFLAKGISKAVPAALKEVATKGAASLAQAVAPLKAILGKVGNAAVLGPRVQIATSVGGMINSGVQGASQMLGAIMEAKGKNIQADFAADPLIRAALVRAQTEAAEAVSSNADIEAKVLELIANMIQSAARTNLAISRL